MDIATIVAHERRITVLEANMQMIMQRLDELDRERAQQAQAREQEGKKVVAELRRQLTESNNKVFELQGGNTAKEKAEAQKAKEH